MHIYIVSSIPSEGRNTYNIYEEISTLTDQFGRSSAFFRPIAHNVLRQSDSAVSFSIFLNDNNGQ